MKLEPKHIAPYFLYGLKGIVTTPIHKEMDYLETISCLPDELITLQINGDWYFNDEYNEFDFKPILRPLSDLNKEIIDEMQESYCFDPSTEKWTEFDSMCDDPVYWSYSDVQILLKHHYDIFNLIENNLAIDINTIK